MAPWQFLSEMYIRLQITRNILILVPILLPLAAKLNIHSVRFGTYR